MRDNVGARKLRVWRAERRLTIEQAAKACGLGRNTFQQLETASRQPTQQTIDRLAPIIGAAPVDWTTPAAIPAIG